MTLARRAAFEQVVAADDVGAVDRLPRAFAREAAEMDDALDTGDRLLDRRHVGEISGDEFLVGFEIARGADITQPQARIDVLEQ